MRALATYNVHCSVETGWTLVTFCPYLLILRLRVQHAGAAASQQAGFLELKISPDKKGKIDYIL